MNVIRIIIETVMDISGRSQSCKVCWRVHINITLQLWWHWADIDDVVHASFQSALLWRHNGREAVSNHQPRDYSTVYSGADQRKHQSSASLAFVWGIQRGPVNSPHKWPVTRKMFPFDDVIMSAVESGWLLAPLWYRSRVLVYCMYILSVVVLLCGHFFPKSLYFP